MAVSFANKNIHTRSASYPPKTNPMVAKIELELQKLAKSEELSTSELETISIGLSGLARLYKCVDLGLKLRTAQQNLLPCHVKPLVETSSKLITISESSKQMLNKLRESVTSSRSSLELATDSQSRQSISFYMQTRKETITIAKAMTLSLKHVESEAAANLGFSQEEESEVGRVLTSITLINISVLTSLYRFFMTKPAKEGLIYKLGFGKKMRGKAATLPARNGNKLSDVDAALVAILRCDCTEDVDGDTLAVALKRLESMEVSLSELEDGLEFIFSVLSKIRSVLLNIVSV